MLRVLKTEEELMVEEVARLRQVELTSGGRISDAASVLRNALDGGQVAIGASELRAAMREALNILTENPYRCR